MATPNYSYEKRQRELAKKRKAEEKRQKKSQRPDDAGAPGEAPQDGLPGDSSADGTPPAQPPAA